MARFGFRDDWLENSYGVEKEHYNNEIDYLDAINTAILELDEDEYELDLVYEDDFNFEEDDEFYYENEEDF